MRNHSLLFLLIGGLLLLNNSALSHPIQARQENVTGDATGGTWQYLGLTGVNAMHLALSSYNKIVLIDKPQANPLQVNGKSAITAEWDLDTNTVRALNLGSDTFCSAGSWAGNGTLVHTGGDGGGGFEPGKQSLRLYDPDVGDWVEKINIMPTKRWYPTMLPLANGSVIIVGGSTGGTGINRAEINNPTYNIWPPTNGGDIPDPDTQFQFLIDTLPYNLYVMLHLVPNSNNANLLFVLANQLPILFNLDTATVVKTYPKIAVQRTYPQTGSSLILPLYPENNYTTEVMVCGGQQAYKIDSIADASCGRMDLNSDMPTWAMDDFGGIPRVMPDSVILADGKIVFLNGAQTGYAGFRKGSPQNALWANSNPAFNPVHYDPISKIYTKMNPSTIARMYHSTATLIPDGSIFVAGSNPQGNVAKDVLFPTEYRAERFDPPYLLTGAPRPVIISIGGVAINQGKIPVKYGGTIELVVKLETTDTPSFRAALIHHGFVTHSQNMGQRYVGLVIKTANFDSTTPNQYILNIDLPPNPTIIAPGPHFLYVLNNDIPCEKGAGVLLN